MYNLLSTYKLVTLILHVVYIHFAASQFGEEVSTCSTKECQEMAQFMLDRMNPSADPCNDFYSFACGNFEKSTALFANFYSTVSMKIKADVNKIFQEPDTSNESKLFNILKQSKRFCEEGSKTLDEFKLMLQELGGFPLIEENWDKSSFDWTKFYEVSLKYGHEPNDLFSINVGPSVAENRQKTLYIGRAKQYNTAIFEGPINHWSFQNADMLLGNGFINHIAKTFGVNVNERKNDLVQLNEFSKAIEAIYAQEVYNYINIQPISELYNLCPSVPWLDIINVLISPKQYTVEDKIVVTCPTCLKKLYSLFQNAPQSLLANYLHFNFIIENIYLLKHAETQALLQSSARLKPEAVCLDYATKYFDKILDYEYVRRFYNLNNTEIAQSIFDTIIPQTKGAIDQQHLFETADQKNAAKEKLEGLFVKFGMNDDLALDYQELETYYKELDDISPELYIWKMRSILLTKTYNSLKKAERPDVYLRAASLENTYIRNMNMLMISAALLQEALRENTPKYINYGRMGVLMAHELTHGFGLRGIDYDKDGNFRNWYNPTTLKNVESSTNCFAEQFDKFPIPGTRILVSGKNVAEECLADNGGFYLSYQAFKNLPSVNQEAALPGFQKYRPKQMFWISYATLMCDTLNYAKYVDLLQNSAFPVSYLRVYLGLQNSKEFSLDFQCRPGPGMNPFRKCTFWNT